MQTKLVARLLDIARSVGPLLPVNASALDTHHAAAGENIRAQVASRLADGTFRVIVDGRAVKLALPADAKPGDVVQLRVTERGIEAAASSGSAGASAGKALSSVGQLIGNLLAQPQAPPPRQLQPVLPFPPQAAADLPAPLARAVARSGLFYESHQARWAHGEYPLERLLEEPQSAVGRRESGTTNGHAPVPLETDLPSLPVPLPRLEPARLPEATPRAAGEAGTAERADVDARPEPVAREALPFVRQQLETLESRQLTWLGDVWPGQPMRWDIGEQPESPNEREEAREWRSRFEMSLPELGDVCAELVLSGKQLRIRLSARDHATAALMQDGGAELKQALAAAGLEVTALKVDGREPAS